MGMAVDLQTTLSSLRREAEALGELQGRCARLREARTRAQLDAAVAAIDARVDACLCIAEHAAAADPTGEWRKAVTELERLLRRLAVLRAQVLGLYAAAAVARGAP